MKHARNSHTQRETKDDRKDTKLNCDQINWKFKREYGKKRIFKPISVRTECWINSLYTVYQVSIAFRRQHVTKNVELVTINLC